MMKNVKKDIPFLLGLVGSASLALVTGGVGSASVLSLLNGIGGNLAANFVWKFNPSKIKRWFVDVHPDDLNHSLKKLFILSIDEALSNINYLYSKSEACEIEKKGARQLIKELRKELKSKLTSSIYIRIDEPEVKEFLYSETYNENAIVDFILENFTRKGVDRAFSDFLSIHLPQQIQLCFGEGLKNPNNQNAWIAFQRMISEEIREKVSGIEEKQQEIKESIDSLKAGTSGFTDEQLKEIIELKNIINNKKLLKEKLNSGINQSLKRIERKEDELIRTSLGIDVNVKDIKLIVGNLESVQKRNSVVMYSTLAIALLLLVILSFNSFDSYFKNRNNSAHHQNLRASTSYSGEDILIDVSLMDYKELISTMNDDEEYIFEWSYPYFHYMDTVIDETYTILSKNRYYNNYCDNHFIKAPGGGIDDFTCNTHACHLDIKIINNSDKTLVLDKLIIEGIKSEMDNTPYLYIATDPAHTSKILFLNESYAKWDGFDFEFSFIKPGEIFNGEYKYKTYIPYFKDSHMLDLKPFVRKEGFNFEKLLDLISKVRINDSEDSDFIMFYNMYGDSVEKYKSYALPFEFLIEGYPHEEEEFNSYSIQAELTGRINFKGNPFSVDLTAIVPITTNAGFGAVLEVAVGMDIELPVDGENYQIKYPVSLSLKPNEAERILVRLTTKQTSNHEFYIRLDNINGTEIKSKNIHLNMYQPRSFQEYLDYMENYEDELLE